MAVPRQGVTEERALAPFGQAPQRRCDMRHIDRWTFEIWNGGRRGRLAPLPGRRFARAEPLHSLEQCRYRRITLGRDVEIGRRQDVILHTEAVMRILVDRDADDLGTRLRLAEGALEQAAEIGPFER